MKRNLYNIETVVALVYISKNNGANEVMDYLLENALEVADYSSMIANYTEMQNEKCVDIYLTLNNGLIDRTWLYNNCEYIKNNYSEEYIMNHNNAVSNAR